jgi:hypothetical protein
MAWRTRSAGCWFASRVRISEAEETGAVSSSVSRKVRAPSLRDVLSASKRTFLSGPGGVLSHFSFSAATALQGAGSAESENGDFGYGFVFGIDKAGYEIEYGIGGRRE